MAKASKPSASSKKGKKGGSLASQMQRDLETYSGVPVSKQGGTKIP